MILPESEESGDECTLSTSRFILLEFQQLLQEVWAAYTQVQPDPCLLITSIH
jgi:hypothetical protein